MIESIIVILIIFFAAVYMIRKIRKGNSAACSNCKCKK